MMMFTRPWARYLGRVMQFLGWFVSHSLVIQHFRMAVYARITCAETKLCVVFARLEPSVSQKRQALW